MKIAVTILQLLSALVLILIVLFQSGKSQGLSGAIGGIADSYMSRSKARSVDAKLAKATVTKIAEVRNTGEADAWIRVRLTGDIRLTGDGTPDPSLVKPDLNTTDWTLGPDGYLYCNKAT